MERTRTSPLPERECPPAASCVTSDYRDDRHRVLRWHTGSPGVAAVTTDTPRWWRSRKFDSLPGRILHSCFDNSRNRQDKTGVLSYPGLVDWAPSKQDE